MGTDILQSPTDIIANMNVYIDSFKPPDGSWKQFATYSAKLARLVNCRPDICASVGKLVQVTEIMYSHDALKITRSVTKLIKYIQGNRINMRFPNGTKKVLKIRACSYASHSSNEDESSQLGYTILPMDDNGQFAIINFNSGKCHTVTESAIASETCAFVD